MLLHIWSGCGGLLNGVAVADVKRCRRGSAPYRAWSRCPSIGVLVAAVLLAPLGAAQQIMLVRAGLWAAVCGPDGVWPCGGVWPREMRVECRRRSKMLCGSHCTVAVTLSVINNFLVLY